MINIIFSLISFVLVFSLVLIMNSTMKRYLTQIEKKEKELSMKKSLDFLIFLTDLVSDSTLTELLQEIMIYITSVKGRDWEQIYEATMKRIKPIQDQLNKLLAQSNELINLQKVSKNIILYSKLIEILLIALVVTTALLIPASVVNWLSKLYLYAILVSIIEIAVILISITLLVKNYRKLNIDIIKDK